MLREFIDRVAELARPEIVEVDGREMVFKDRVLAVEPFPAPIEINNLSGICDFLKGSKEYWEKPLIHVRDYNRVVMYQSMSGTYNQRPEIIISKSRECEFKFGYRYSYEDFIIAIHSQFCPTEDRDYILKFISSVRIDANAKVEDDGISQTLTAKQGVSSLVKDIPVKNVVHLRPYRTFSEIEQPLSMFVFRMKIEENKPVFSIHEADGAAWKQAAIEGVRNYFLDKPVSVPVIA